MLRSVPCPRQPTTRLAADDSSTRPATGCRRTTLRSTGAHRVPPTSPPPTPRAAAAPRARGPRRTPARRSRRRRGHQRDAHRRGWIVPRVAQDQLLFELRGPPGRRTRPRGQRSPIRRPRLRPPPMRLFLTRHRDRWTAQRIDRDDARQRVEPSQQAGVRQRVAQRYAGLGSFTQGPWQPPGELPAETSGRRPAQD
jgi:hypothetical protein